MTSLNQATKSAIRQFLAGVYSLSGLYKTLHKGKVLILMYHRVLSQKELDKYFVQPGMYVHVDAFEKQMQFLKKNFLILSFSELLELWRERKISKDQRYCVITFDDGWVDNYLYAYPILKKYNIPATIFLATAFIGTSLWLWPEKVGHLLKHYYAVNLTKEEKRLIDPLKEKYSWLKSATIDNSNQNIDSVVELCKTLSDEEIRAIIESLQTVLGFQFPKERMFLDWEEVREMSKNGLSFGSHTDTHKILIKYPEETIQRELSDSYKDLSAREINFTPVFCYPNGDYNPEIIEQVKKSGYQAAVTTRIGFENVSDSHSFFELHRIGIQNGICQTVPLFQFHISGLRKTFCLQRQPNIGRT